MANDIDGFPNNPSENEKFSPDKDYYVFNREDNTWKLFGSLIKEKVVGCNVNGLITPRIVCKLLLLQSLFNNNKFKSFQLNDRKAYFYLFNNSDHCIKFIFDGSNLFVEINKSVLINKIRSRSFCIGKRGVTGIQGIKGINGSKASKEKFISKINKKFEVDVPTPLDDQPISVRGFTGKKQVFEIFVNLDGNVQSNGYFKSLEFSNNILKGELLENYDIKARQRGPIGFNGDDGSNNIIINRIVKNQGDAFPISAVINFRGSNNKMVWKNDVVPFTPFCVFSVKAQSLPIGKLWVGSEITTRECKDIEIVSPDAILDKLILDLPLWTPLAGCYDQSRSELAKFDWYKQFDLPFDILDNPDPKLNSCAVPFWFCGNSGNMPCDDKIDIEVPIVIGNDKSSESSESSESSSESSSSQSNSESSSQSNSESSSSQSNSESSSSQSNSESSSSQSNSESSSSNSSQSLSSQSLSSQSLSSQSSGPHGCCDFSLYEGKTFTFTHVHYQKLLGDWDGEKYTSCSNSYSVETWTGIMTGSVYDGCQDIECNYVIDLGNGTECANDCNDYSPVAFDQHAENIVTVTWCCSDLGEPSGNYYFPSAGDFNDIVLYKILHGIACDNYGCISSIGRSYQRTPVVTSYSGSCFNMNAIVHCCVQHYINEGCVNALDHPSTAVIRDEWTVTIT